MKKVLLATTALAMTAGMASADVALSGYAEMGVASDDGNVGFVTDIDVTFTMSGETDGGLSFGASIDLDESDGDPSGAFAEGTQGGESIFVKGDFGTITMGDTDGAFDWAMSEIGWGTTLTDDHTGHAGWNGNSGLDGRLDGQIARYDYAFGDFGIAVSAEIGDDNEADFGEVLEEDNQFFDDDEIFGIGAKYASDFGGAAIGFGIGYQTGAGADGGDADIVGMSLTGDMDNGFSARFNYSRLDSNDADGTNDTDRDHYGVGFAYTMDALLVEVNYGRYDRTVDGVEDEADGFGIAANYDLGGGATFMVGYGKGQDYGSGSVDSASAGIGFAF